MPVDLERIEENRLKFLAALYEIAGIVPNRGSGNLTLCGAKRRDFGAFSLRIEDRVASCESSKCQAVRPRISRLWDDPKSPREHMTQKPVSGGITFFYEYEQVIARR